MAAQDYNKSVISDLVREEIQRRPRGAASRLAETVGVTPQTVSKWVHGQSTPDMESWTRVAEALDLPPDAFFVAAFGSRSPTVDDRVEAVEGEVRELRSMVEELVRRDANSRSGRARE